jgi:hypothetical protein
MKESAKGEIASFLLLPSSDFHTRAELLSSRLSSTTRAQEQFCICGKENQQLELFLERAEQGM